MKIKVSILEKDPNYLKRMVSTFGIKYPDKLEIYSFTDLNIALRALIDSKINVFIADEDFDIDINTIPENCGFAYFVSSSEIDTVKGQRAVCKFQKAELIYKQILSIYSENAGNISGVRQENDNTNLIICSSPCGGTGTSSVAAACALHFSRKNKKVLYLNLEKFGSSDMFFQGESLFDMSDIIYALKSKKVNLAMKLESCVNQDVRGVYYYSHPKVALDMLEMSSEDVCFLISELRLTGAYDYIVVDLDFGLDINTLNIYKAADKLLSVGDGSELSFSKIRRAYQAVSVMEQNSEVAFTDKLYLIYNKFSNKTGKDVGDIGIKVVGGAQVFLHANTAEVIEQLALKGMFSEIS